MVTVLSKTIVDPSIISVLLLGAVGLLIVPSTLITSYAVVVLVLLIVIVVPSIIRVSPLGTLGYNVLPRNIIVSLILLSPVVAIFNWYTLPSLRTISPVLYATTALQFGKVA